jgi:hypothetical protein
MGLIENYKEFLNRKFKDLNDIPEFPRCNSEEHEELVNLYIKAGAISKSELKPGGWYIGQCRNTTIAQWWPKSGFNYIRYKFGDKYVDTINHFEDDNGYDLFIPFKLIYCEK